MEKQLIQVNVKDTASLKNAILTFTSQLRDAYQTGELINNVGGFVSHDTFATYDTTRFRACDLLDPAQFKAIFMLHPAYELESPPVEPLTDEQQEKLVEDAVYLRFSHFVVFQHALAHEELKSLLTTFCEELVEFSLQVNSSNELFFSSDMLFGIYLLVLLAEKYPEYAYLIGEYYPEDSDFNQIMHHGADYMAYLYYQHGYSNLYLDALASCHFPSIRGCILSYYSEPERFVPNLLTCFLADENRYFYYKDALIQSLKRRPRDVGEYDLFEHLEDDFDSIRDEYDYDEDYQNDLISRDTANGEFDDLMFHGQPVAEAREALRKELYDAVKNVPLKDLYYYDQPIYDETTTLADIEDDPFYQEYDEHNEYETNSSFFLECFDNGEQILAYIEENRHPDVLDQLEPINFRKRAFEHKHYIYKRFEYFGSGDMQLSPNLNHDISLEDIIERFMVTYQNPDSFYIEDDGEQAQNDKCLRTLDVLVRLFGKKELTGDEIKIVTKDYELCSKKEAVERFTIKALTAEEIHHRAFYLINEPMVDTFSLIRLREIYELYLRDKAQFGDMLKDIIVRAHQETPNDILGVIPALNQTEYAKGAQLLSVAYILSQEANGFFSDQALEPLWAFYNEHIFKRVYFEIGSQNTYSHAFEEEERAKAPVLIDQIKAYIDAQQTKTSGSLFARLMKKPVEQENNPDVISFEQALAIAHELLVRDNTANDEKERTSLFVSDDIGMLLASLLYVANVAKGPQKKQLLSLYQLILELFPASTLLVTFREFSEGNQFFNEATDTEVETFCDFLSDLNIDEKYAFLFRIAVVHEVNEYEDDLDDFCDEYGLKRMYENMLNLYRNKDDIDPNETGMMADREKKIAQAITAAVEMLSEENRNKFLSFV